MGVRTDGCDGTRRASKAEHDLGIDEHASIEGVSSVPDGDELDSRGDFL